MGFLEHSANFRVRSDQRGRVEERSKQASGRMRRSKDQSTAVKGSFLWTRLQMLHHQLCRPSHEQHRPATDSPDQRSPKSNQLGASDRGTSISADGGADELADLAAWLADLDQARGSYKGGAIHVYE